MKRQKEGRWREKKKEGKVGEEKGKREKRGDRWRQKEIRTETETEEEQRVIKRGIKGQRVSLNVINMTVSGWQQG